MSEPNKENDSKRVPFEVTIDEHYDFDAIAASKFITSNELCKMVSDLLHGVFADYEGCIFEINQGMEPTISLIFNHGDYSNSDLPCACERNGVKQVGNTIIDRGRSRDQFNRNGDRYYLTEDGQDFVKQLIIRRLYNNGNLDYKRIVGEIVDRGPINTSFVAQMNQYTKVSFISIDRLCALLFGTDEESGDRVEYTVGISAPINPGYNTAITNYVLNITRISAKELSNFCNKIGVNMQAINIVR